MLPLRPLRAALLAFVGALVMVEAGSGVVALEAWRQQSGGALTPARLTDLHDMLANLRTVENLVVGGVLAMIVVWALAALHNATLVAHGSVRTGAIAVGTLLGGPILFLAVRAAEPDGGVGRIVNLVLQAVALYLPFWGLGRAADGIGGTRLTFFRWYLALVASYLVHALFTAQLDVLDPKGPNDLGRTTMFFFINALVVAVMGVMAAEATRGMDRSIVERALQRRLLRDDASLRTRAAADGPSLPPPSNSAPHGTPSLPPPANHGGGVAVLEAPVEAPAAVDVPVLAAAPAAVLAPPSAAPVIPGPAEGAMPLPKLAAVRVPSSEPEVVTPAVAIPVIAAEPLTVEPVVTEPAAAEPVAVPQTEPVAAEPVATVPTVIDAVTPEPILPDPVSVESVAVLVEPMSVLVEPVSVVVEPVVVEPMTVEPVVAQPEPSLVSPTLPPPVPAPLPPPPPGSRSSMPKLLTITEMRPIPVIEPEVEPEPEVEEVVVAPEPQPVAGFSSMFQPLTPRQP